jgi:hypothetical protein
MRNDRRTQRGDPRPAQLTGVAAATGGITLIVAELGDQDRLPALDQHRSRRVTGELANFATRWLNTNFGRVSCGVALGWSIEPVTRSRAGDADAVGDGAE